MNIKMVFGTVGRILKVETLLLLLPLIVSVIYGESRTVYAFGVVILVAALTGILLSAFTKTKNRIIYAKEGFAIVALAWVGLSAIGALPFVISGAIPSYVDAFFETVSGFTTTGASVVPDVEVLSHGVMFWRSFTHWVGGMGVLVFVMALMPNISDRSIHIMRAEVPGPVVGKLVPKIKDTAKILYLIYIALTAAEIIFLICGGMSFFESLIHAMGTAGTGGFGIKNSSIGGYSPYIQWVIAIFMLVFGINFNVYYFILIRRAKTALKSAELWAYLAMAAVASVLITLNLRSVYPAVSEALRQAVFQVSSIITTTGYATADFNQWPLFSKAILLILMLSGGCAGSTAGGLKVSRVVILIKAIGREVRRLIHPRSVSAISMEGKPLEDRTISGVCVYFAIYIVSMVVLFLLLCLEGGSLETHLSAVVACFNNVGPGLAEVGPASNYNGYSDASKLLLSAAMLFGRLEIFPMLITLAPGTWTKK